MPNKKIYMSRLTFWIVLQQEVEVAQLTKNIRVHFPLCFQDEGIIAVNSLNERKSSAELKECYKAAVKHTDLNGW